MYNRIIRLINGNDPSQKAIVSITDESIKTLYDRALDFAEQLWGKSEDHQAEDVEIEDIRTNEEFPFFLDNIDNYEK